MSQRYNSIFVALFGLFVVEALHIVYTTRRSIKLQWRKILSRNQPALINTVLGFDSMLGFTCSAIALTDLVHPECDNSMEMYHVRHCIASVSAIFTLLSLLQAYPPTAYLLVIMKKMSLETITFATVGFPFYAAFTAVFYILETPFQCFDSAATNKTNQQNLVGTIYISFLSLMNIKSPDDVYFSYSSMPTMSIVMLAIMVWPVMLLNLLIALYNDRMPTITKHQEVITAVQNLQIMLFAYDTHYITFQKIKQ